MESVIGKIVGVRFYNEQNKYIIALVESKDDEKLIVVTGQMVDFQEEKLYQFDGDYVIHPKYGRQFKFICYQELLVTGHNEVVKYLSSSIFKGIGKVLANRIVETLGENALEKIVADKNCLDKVPGITPTKKQQIYEQLNVEGNHEIATFLLQHGLHMSIVEKIMATYQENAYEMIQENPYCMLEDIENMRFKTVDQFAMSLGVDYNDFNRVKALIEYTIKECCYQTGDTYLLFDQLLKKIKSADRRLDQNVIGECIDLLVKQNRIYLKEDMVFSYIYEEAENGIVSKLTYFNSLFVEENTSQQIEEMIQFIQEKDHIQFASKQKKAIVDFMKYPMMILTGGPGTGKSTIVKAAIEVYRKYESNAKIALVAPTGRAAKRLSDLTGLEAHTIHRLLRWDISKNEFMVNEDSPLPIDLLVIDEFSMVDTVLFHYLLKASRLVKKILIIGDIIGRPGREILKLFLEKNKKNYDFVIVNGENAAAGFGLTAKLADDLLANGCDVITSGNHIWDKKEMYEYLDKTDRVLRPANYPDENTPGKGYTIVKDKKGNKIGVVSIQGRVFMMPIDCPFKKIKEIIAEIRKETKFIIVDFHAEATSEKVAMGWHIDGQVSAIYGTHTHIQTADEKILPEGTGYITDIGMTGSENGIIGMKVQSVLPKFLNALPQRFEIAEGNERLCGIDIELDEETGECKKIERISKTFMEISYL